MKRKLTGGIKAIGYYPVIGMKALYILPFEVADEWQERKGTEAIALLWNGKIHFRKLYYRNRGACFKFFNRIIYLNEIVRIEATYVHIYE